MDIIHKQWGIRTENSNDEPDQNSRIKAMLSKMKSFMRRLYSKLEKELIKTIQKETDSGQEKREKQLRLYS